MISNWLIELKLKKGDFFYTAEPKTDMSHIIDTKVKMLVERLGNLETEMILANLPEEQFKILKEQVRSESKKRDGKDYYFNNDKNMRAH